jgi:hypothetical protein
MAQGICSTSRQDTDGAIYPERGNSGMPAQLRNGLLGFDGFGFDVSENGVLNHQAVIHKEKRITWLTAPVKAGAGEGEV